FLRRHPLGGSGACTRKPIRRRLQFMQQWRNSSQLTQLIAVLGVEPDLVGAAEAREVCQVCIIGDLEEGCSMRAISLALIGLAVVLVPAPASAGTSTVAPLVVVSNTNPYATCTVGAGTGTNYVDAEVEPQIAADPTAPKHFVAAWQQDRWS